MSIEENQKEILKLEQSKKDVLKNIEETKEKIKQAIDSNDFELVTKLTNKLNEYSNSIKTTDEKIIKLSSEIKKNQENQDKIEELKKEAKVAIDLGNYEAIEKITKKIIEYESPTKTTEKEDETTDQKESVYHYNEKKDEYHKKYFKNSELLDFSPDIEEFIEKHGAEFDNVYLFPLDGDDGRSHAEIEETFIERFNTKADISSLQIKGKNYCIDCTNCSKRSNDDYIDFIRIIFIGKNGVYEIRLNALPPNELCPVTVLFRHANNEALDKFLKERNESKIEPNIDKNWLQNYFLYGCGIIGMPKEWIDESTKWFEVSIETFDEFGLTTLVGDQKQRRQFKSIEEIFTIVNSPEFEAHLESVYDKMSSKSTSVGRQF